MQERFTLTTSLDRSTLVNGVTVDWEFDVDVVYRYLPGRPAVMYLRNGDPGYPAEPSEVEILSCRPRDPKLGTDLVAEDALTDEEVERLIDAAHADMEKQLYDPQA